MNKSLPIQEDFLSIQGEGEDVGLPTYFIRVAGCNLAEKGGCKWCDTKYAWSPDQGKRRSFQKIIDRIPLYPGRVSITGGEPLSHPEMPDFLGFLVYKTGAHVLVETNGSLPLLPRSDLATVRWSVDLKCPSSGMSDYNLYENVEILRLRDQLKFVIACREDYIFAKNVLQATSFRRSCPVVFQPAYGTMDPAILTQWILEDQLQVRLSLQIHKILWGERRGV